MITYDVNLCIGKDHQDSGLVIKCHDTGVNLRAFLQVCRPGKWQEVFEPYTIPMGSTAVLKITKPDKKYCIKDGTVGTNGVVLFEMPTQAFTAAGTGKAEVSLFSCDGARITSATFEIEIPEECICECELESENYIDVMGEQIAKAIDAADRAEKAILKGPIIQDGNWWLFDPIKGEYVDTGICAQPSGDIDPEAIANSVADYFAENPVEVGATEEEAAQIAQNKQDIEKLNTVKLDADKLTEALNYALAQAKASGQFDGKDGYTPQKGIDYFDGDPGEPGKDYNLTEADKQEIAGMVEAPPGYTPVKGTDYWTEADKQEIKSYVDNAILGGAW